MPDEQLLITAIVAFLAALAAVMLEHGLARARDRRDRIERACLELMHVISVAATGLSQAVTEDERLSNEYIGARDRTLMLLTQIRVDAKGPWMRNAAEVRRSAEDLGARFGALWMLAMRGEPVSVEESITFASTDLQDAVFGKRPTLESALEWYVTHGFSEPAPRDVYR